MFGFAWLRARSLALKKDFTSAPRKGGKRRCGPLPGLGPHPPLITGGCQGLALLCVSSLHFLPSVRPSVRPSIRPFLSLVVDLLVVDVVIGPCKLLSFSSLRPQRGFRLRRFSLRTNTRAPLLNSIRPGPRSDSFFFFLNCTVTQGGLSLPVFFPSP